MKTTHVVLVLDSSGSMHGTREQAVENYNEQIRAFKKAAEEGGEVKVSLITFNTDVYEHLWEQSAVDLKECNHGDYIANGWTSMLDAIGYGIEKMQETTKVDDPDNVYLFIVITDGDENHSTHYSRGKLFEMIDSLQRTNRWTFTFMGCSEQYIRQTAQELGVPVANCAVWSNATPAAANFGYRSAAKRMRSVVRGMASGQSAGTSNFYSDSIEFCADFSDDSIVDTPLAADPPAPVSSDSINVFSNCAKVTTWKM